MAGDGLPPGMHPDVAAILRDAKRIEDVLEERLHQIRTGRFTAANDDRTVEVTLDSQYQMVDVFISDGLLRSGIPEVEKAVNEALRNANAEVDASATAASARINAVIADITGRDADSSGREP